jgi:hypothetical protein
LTLVERPLLGVFLIEHGEPDQQRFEGESVVGSCHATQHSSQIKGIKWNEKLINRTAERLLIQSAHDMGMEFCSANDSFCALLELMQMSENRHYDSICSISAPLQQQQIMFLGYVTDLEPIFQQQFCHR